MSDNHQLYQQFATAFADSRIAPFAYLLMERLQAGHICIPLADFEKLPDDFPYPLSGLPDFANMQPLVSTDGEKLAPFIVANQRIYLQRYYAHETRIVEILREKIARSKQAQSERKAALEAQRAVIENMNDKRLANNNPQSISDWQLIGAINAALHDFSIITGGPGTGKTTTLAKLLRIIYAQQSDARVALAAPTGKAAMRMKDSLLAALQNPELDFVQEIKTQIEKLKPSTLHSLLGFQRNSIEFRHHRNFPLPYDWVIVDEASMIDVPMFARLLDALGDNVKLVLLGDKDQLASVQAGSLLGDLCQTNLNQFTPAHKAFLNGFIANENAKIVDNTAITSTALLSDCITELKHSHRFDEKSGIGSLARAILDNKPETLRELLHQTTQSDIQIDESYSDAQLKDFVTGFADYINESDIAEALKKFNRLRVLCAVREGEHGVVMLNQQVEMILRENGILDNAANNSQLFYPNRPVMVTRNNYELGIMNGDIGLVRPDSKNPKRLLVWFIASDGQLRSVTPAALNDCETAFVMTIHKSQGSEFDKVLLRLPKKSESGLLSNELLYTGVTRAKKSVLIQANLDMVSEAIGRKIARASGLADRLKH